MDKVESLKVIPVIDILNCVVVHAVRGRRQEYQPLQSSLCKSTEPLEVAKTFKSLGFSELYIADLDAIAGGQVNIQVLKRMADESRLKLIVDVGVTDLETAKKLLKNGVSKVVIGTETLQNKNFVCEAIRVLGNARVMVSLDFKGDRVLLKLRFTGCADPMCLLREFKGMGVSEFIVLDLARVGSCEGVNLDFLKKAIEEKVDVYVGGGVRDINDLIELKELGVCGALIATALHSAKISVEALKQNKLL
jgi:phosphoribosylformimino-5-aminoimidazole carboxamide ribotide isomerase